MAGGLEEEEEVANADAEKALARGLEGGEGWGASDVGEPQAKAAAEGNVDAADDDDEGNAEVEEEEEGGRIAVEEEEAEVV